MGVNSFYFTKSLEMSQAACVNTSKQCSDTCSKYNSKSHFTSQCFIKMKSIAYKKLLRAVCYTVHVLVYHVISNKCLSVYFCVAAA